MTRFALEKPVTSARMRLITASANDKWAHTKAAATEAKAIQLMSGADAGGQCACPLPGDVNK
jgi:hypothetical protein